MKKAVACLVFVLLLAFSLAALAELRVLSYGTMGEDVTALQSRLAELGYYTFRITGNYQENSQKAVREFQAAHGLAVTGIADGQLQRLLHSADAMPKATPTPKPTPDPTPEWTPAPQTTKAPEETDAFPGNLQFGSTGDAVRRVQRRLKELGFYEMEDSGNFLGNTRNAVRAFQRHNGLVSDGVVGATTWQMLFVDPAVLDVRAAPRPTPSPTPVPYRIGVDVTNQVTTVYGLDESGGYTKVLKHMLCSTGTTKDPTPLRTYTLNGATARWCYFPKWGSHAQYWTRISASIAFHSVIYTSPDPMALAASTYTGLGKRASHGCIRLMVDDAKWIYQNCGKGTQVEVYEGKADQELTKSLKIPPLDYSVMRPKPTPGPTEPPPYRPDALPPMPFTTLSKGAEGEAVYWLQRKLSELGYYGGSVTGGYYDGTIAAVMAFQRDHGLSVDGQAGKQTLGKLYEDVLATPSPDPTLTPTMAPSGTPGPLTTVVPEPSPSAMPTQYSWLVKPNATPSANPTPAPTGK